MIVQPARDSCEVSRRELYSARRESQAAAGGTANMFLVIFVALSLILSLYDATVNHMIHISSNSKPARTADVKKCE